MLFRSRVKQEVNANSLAKYDWFKEEMGEKHWVLYNTAMYEIEHTAIYWKFYLHYKENSGLTPITPINATSCHRMFSCCSNLKSLDIRNFDTSSVIDMRYMFSGCSKLTSLDFTGFDTSQVINMKGMFDGCSSLTFLDLGSLLLEYSSECLACRLGGDEFLLFMPDADQKIGRAHV